MTGKDFEDEVSKYLIKLKYKIVKRNFKSKVGEIDIIAKDGKTIVFVEVKGRNSDYPVENIDENKIFKIRKVAELYLSITNSWEEDMRFDAIIIRNIHNKITIEHIKEAF
jgi:putative endonuclease